MILLFNLKVGRAIVDWLDVDSLSLMLLSSIKFLGAPEICLIFLMGEDFDLLLVEGFFDFVFDIFRALVVLPILLGFVD